MSSDTSSWPPRADASSTCTVVTVPFDVAAVDDPDGTKAGMIAGSLGEMTRFQQMYGYCKPDLAAAVTHLDGHVEHDGGPSVTFGELCPPSGAPMRRCSRRALFGTREVGCGREWGDQTSTGPRGERIRDPVRLGSRAHAVPAGGRELLEHESIPRAGGSTLTGTRGVLVGVTTHNRGGSGRHTRDAGRRDP